MRYMIPFLLMSLAYGAELRQDVTLTINGKVYVIAQGSVVQIDQLSISASIATTKTFVCDRYSFHIPADFSLTTDATNANCIFYTFHGEHGNVTIHELSPEYDSNAFITSLLKDIPINLKVESTTIAASQPLKMLQKNIAGQQLMMHMGETEIHYFFYGFSCGGKHLVVALQRTNDQESVEKYNQVVALLQTTFTELKK